MMVRFGDIADPKTVERVDPCDLAKSFGPGVQFARATIAVTDEQLADNLAAADLVLTGEDIAALEEVSRPPLLYPYWHQAASARDRLGAADRILLDPHLQA